MCLNYHFKFTLNWVFIEAIHYFTIVTYKFINYEIYANIHIYTWFSLGRFIILKLSPIKPVLTNRFFLF